MWAATVLDFVAQLPYTRQGPARRARRAALATSKGFRLCLILG